MVGKEGRERAVNATVATSSRERVQYVRKVSGFTKPSAANEAAFERAVDEVAATTSELIASLVTNAPPRDREAEAARAHERAVRRFGS
jgi:hypothetical protein